MKGKPKELKEPDFAFTEHEIAFGRAYRSYRADGRPRMDPDTFFRSIREELIKLIIRKLKDLRSARVQTTTWVRFRQGENLVELACNSRMTEVYKGSNLESIIDGMINHMKTQIENPGLLKNRFIFDEVLFLDVNFHRLNLTRGGSYLPLPEFIVNKKAMINSRNEDDDECFKWAVIAVLHHAEIKVSPERIYSLKKFVDNYDWSGLSFPTPLKEIKIFEVKNGISVNVLGAEGNDTYICRKGGGYDQ